MHRGLEKNGMTVERDWRAFEILAHTSRVSEAKHQNQPKKIVIPGFVSESSRLFCCLLHGFEKHNRTSHRIYHLSRVGELITASHSSLDGMLDLRDPLQQ